MVDISEVRDSYIIETALQDGISGPAQAAAAHLDGMETAAISAAKAVSAAGASLGETARVISTVDQQWEKIARRNDDVTGASVRLANAQQILQRAQIAATKAMADGGADIDQINRVLANLSKNVTDAAQTFLVARDNADAAAEAQRTWAGSMEDSVGALGILSDKAQAFALVNQAAINKNLGVQAPTSDADYAKRAADIAAYGQALDGLRAKYDPLFKVSKDYEAAVNGINDARAKGAISEQVQQAQLEETRLAFQKLAGPVNDATNAIEEHGLTARQSEFLLHGLTRESVGMFAELQAGAPVVAVLTGAIVKLGAEFTLSKRGFALVTEQMHNVVEAVGGWPVVTVGLIIAGLGAIGALGESSAREMQTFRAQLSATRTDFAEMSEQVETSGKQIAAGTTLGREAATKLALALAQMPSVTGESLTQLGIQVANLARAMGTDIPTATKLMTTALVDPAKAAADMATADKPLTAMTATLLQTVLALTATGDKAGATALVLGAIGTQSKVSSEQITPLQAAMKKLDEALTTTGNNGKSFTQQFGEDIALMASGVVNSITSMIDGLRGFSEYLDGAIVKFDRWRHGLGPAPVETKDKEGNVTSTSATTNTAAEQQQRDHWLSFQGAQPTAVSSAGALGTMQVMPATANAYGLNPAIPSDNVLAGMTMIKELSQQFKDPQQVAGAYNMGAPDYVANPQGAKKYQNAVYHADISKLPEDTASMIEYWGNVLGMTEQQIALGKRIAVVENQGQQGPLNAKSPGIGLTLKGPAREGGGEGEANKEHGATEVTASSRDAIAGAAAVGGSDTQQATIDKLKTSLRQFNAERDELLKKPKLSEADQKNLTVLDGAIAKTTEDMKNARDPSLQQTRQLEDQAKVAGTVGAASQALLAVRQQIAAFNQANPDHPKGQAQENELLAATQDHLTGTYNAYQHQLSVSTQATQAQIDALGKGANAVQAADIQQQAYQKSLDFYVAGSPAQIKAAEDIAAAMQKDADAKNTAAREQTFINNDRNIDFIRTETATLGMNADARAVLLARIKAENDLRASGKPFSDADLQRTLQQTQATTELSLAYQHTQESLSFVSGQMTQAFDSISNAMTNAFVSGQGKAIQWGNVMAAVAQQVLAAFIKLAVINPLLNSITGGSSPTLSSVVNALGSSSQKTLTPTGTTSDGQNIFTLGNGSTVVSGASTISGAFGGPTGTSLLSSAFINASGSGGGIIGAGGSLTGAGGLFSPGLTAAQFSAASTALPEGVAGPVLSGSASQTAGTLGGLGASSSTLAAAGGITGGVVAGEVGGHLAGNAVQKGLDKTGPGVEIGTGVGTVAGVGIGFVLGGPIGALAGGLIGGTAGGSIGGLFGPHTPSSFSTSELTTSNGQFQKSPLVSQSDRDAVGEDNTVNNTIGDLNKLMSAAGIAVGALDKRIQIGDNNPTGFQDPTKFSDLNTPNVTGQNVFSQLRFSSTDPIAEEKLANHPFFSTAEFATWVASFTDTQTKAKAALAALDQNAKDLGETTGGTLPNQIKALNDSFNADKATIDALLATSNLSGDQTEELAKGEERLMAARDKAVASANAAAALQEHQADQALDVRQANALAVFTGNPEDATKAQLLAFDVKAQKELADFKTSEETLYGEAYSTTAEYLAKLNKVEQTQGDERANIVKAGNDVLVANAKATADALKAASQQIAQALKAASDQAANSAASFINSLKQFSTSLQTGSASPLSPSQQFDAAQKDFTTTATGAKNGDAASLANLQNSANILLTTGKAYFGSTTGYDAVFQEVTDAIKAVGKMTTTALNNAFKTTASNSPDLNLQISLADLQNTLGLPATAFLQHKGLPGGVTDPGVTGFTGLAAGGWVGNGQWNQDSVAARYAPGDPILLAGGEFVVNAVSAAKHADILPLLNDPTAKVVPLPARNQPTATDDHAAMVAQFIAPIVSATTAHLSAAVQPVAPTVSSPAAPVVVAQARDTPSQIIAQAVQQHAPALDQPAAQPQSGNPTAALARLIVTIANTGHIPPRQMFAQEDKAASARIAERDASTAQALSVASGASISIVDVRAAQQKAVAATHATALNPGIDPVSHQVDTASVATKRFNQSIAETQYDELSRLATRAAPAQALALGGWVGNERGKGDDKHSFHAHAHAPAAARLSVPLPPIVDPHHPAPHVSNPGASAGHASAHGLVTGGWVGNGIWNKDSVAARYQGGSDILLAGGEFVVNAPAARRFAHVLAAINDNQHDPARVSAAIAASTHTAHPATSHARGLAEGGWVGSAPTPAPMIVASPPSSNDNDILNELRALRLQTGLSSVAETRNQTASLLEELRALKAEMAALRADMNRAGNKPGRLAS